MLELYRHSLKNGLRVWCVPRPNSQTAAVLAHLPVGTRTENKDNNGISHFLEHMVFTGTERWNESEVTDVVRRRGGECNGQTAREETTFYIHVAAQDFEFALDWMHQLLFKPTLTEEKFEKERQVIMSEKGGEYDYLRRTWEWIEDHNWGWSIARAVRRRIYPDSPFLLPIIGTDKTLKAMTHQDLIEYHEKFYVPNNMTLIVIGDVIPEHVFALAERQYAEIPSRTSPPTHPLVKVVPEPFHVRLYGPTPNQQGQLYYGAMLGPCHHPDRYAWWLMVEMLENAYLQEIRYELGLSYGVSVYPVLYTDSGYFNVYTTAKIDDFDTIQHAIEKHLDRLVAGEFTEQEVLEAKAALRGRALLDLQDNLEFASWLTTDIFIFQDNEPIQDYFEEIGQLTWQDIHRVAQQYLDPTKRFSVIHRPSITPRQLRPFAIVGAAGLAGAAFLANHRRK